MMNFIDFTNRIAESPDARDWLAARCAATGTLAAAVAKTGDGELCVVWFGPSRRVLPEFPGAEWTETGAGYRVVVPAGDCADELTRRFPLLAPTVPPDDLRPLWADAPTPEICGHPGIFPIFPWTPGLTAQMLAFGPRRGYGVGRVRAPSEGLAETGRDTVLAFAPGRDAPEPVADPAERARIEDEYVNWRYLDETGGPVAFADAAVPMQCAADARVLSRLLKADRTARRTYAFPRRSGPDWALALRRECKLLKLNLTVHTGE